MSVIATVTEPFTVFPSKRRPRPGFVDNSWRYFYRSSVSGDGTGGTLTVNFTPPDAVGKRNRLTIIAWSMEADDTAGTTAARLSVFSAATALFRSRVLLSATSTTRDVPWDQIPRFVVPDAVPDLSFETQITNTNLVAYVARLDLLVEAFEPG